MSKPVQVLYLGSLIHAEDWNSIDKAKPHQDQIEFQNAVSISCIRIPKPGKDLYSKVISMTQNVPIKNFEIYYRNLEKTNGRFSLLTSNNELLISSSDDILITPKQSIFTDFILIKGNFTKLTLCIYGNLLKDQSILLQKCPNFKVNANIEPLNQGTIQIEKDVFEQKREAIREIQREIESGNDIQEWHSVVNDDGINQQQIENICNLSQKLLTSYTSQNLSQESFVVQFRVSLEEISTNLAKIFKNKHIGLYYPSYEESNISNDLPVSITTLALQALKLSISEQVRGLQILKYTLQLDRHSTFFIRNQGVQTLIRLFVDFFKPNAITLSTFKNLFLEVFISLSQWEQAAKIMVKIIKETFYHKLFSSKAQQKEKIQEQRQRSREKKTKKSRSYSSDSDDEPKKKKKDKKKNKQKEKQKEKQRKKEKQSKSKDQLLKKSQQKQVIKKICIIDQVPNLSFYEIVLFELSRQTNSKQLILLKMLIQQILQTITKNGLISQRVSFSTSLLKDIKYLFNPAGEVLNTKSLKQFASYQPFLNNLQSLGVDSEIISERQKLKNMKKYNIDPKICKIINKINIQIASSESDQYLNEAKTPFDSQFIVMMSELIRHKDKSVLYGFNRIVNAFKIESSNDIIYLKKIEAAMTMISQYIYKILLEDTGLYTVLNIDQIYASLINITNCLSKDPSVFTKELKRNIKKLTNYAMAYDLFNSSEGNFKVISDSFLKLFKFQHYEINKISDYKKKEFDKSSKPFLLSSLNQTLNLGNFQQLLPDQPLLQIDVYLKIFNVLLQYNKNVWTLFYENKLLCGFSVLYIKLTNIVCFLLSSSFQRQSALKSTKKYQLSVQNYLTVLERVLNILVKKAEYEAAFNDLIDQDNFKEVQLYQKSLELYIVIFNAINQNSSLISKKGQEIGERILSQILQIYDRLIESYELTTHISRESKIKQLWYLVYITHYTKLCSRAACLSLFSFFIQTIQPTSTKLFNTVCIDENIKDDSYLKGKFQGYLPQNDKSIIQNLIITNIFRKDQFIKNNLCILIRKLFDKHSQKNPTLQKVSAYFQSIFDQIQNNIKQNVNSHQQQIKIKTLFQKMVFLTQLIKNINVVMSPKFQLKMIKFIKFIDNSYKLDKQIIPNESQLKFNILLLKIKTYLIISLKQLFIQKKQHPQFLSMLQMMNKNLQLSSYLNKIIYKETQSQISNIQLMFLNQHTNLVSSCLDFIVSISSNVYYQSLMLYEVFMEKPYKPSPQINLNRIFNKYTSNQLLDFLKHPFQLNQNKNQVYDHRLQSSLKQIFIKIIFLLCQLTTIDDKQFYVTQSRRNAIISLITDQKEFPFNTIQQCLFFLPQEFYQNLKNYYSYPIVQKPITIKQQHKKDILKNKGYIFSKSVFSMIMEGQPTAKTRYSYIGGPWKSGDIKSETLFTPSRQRQYLQIVQRSLQPKQVQDKQIYQLFLKRFINCNKQIFEPQGIYQFSTKKRIRTIQKKANVQCQIRMMNITQGSQNSQSQFLLRPDQIKKTSPSPSNKYPPQNYGKTKTLQPTQYDKGERVSSPSPQTNKASYQSVIGFNSPNGNAIYGQATNVMGTKPVELQNQVNRQPQIYSNSPNFAGYNQQKVPDMNSISPNLPIQDISLDSRSPSNSAPRPPYPNYPQYPQAYYPGQYPNQVYAKSQSFDNRGPVPYQKTYPPTYPPNYASQNIQNSRPFNVSNQYYNPPQQQQPQQNTQYNQYNQRGMQQQRGQQRTYGNYQQGYAQYPQGPQEYPTNPQYLQNLEEERQYDEAVLLLTQLRGNLPDHMKAEKKLRLNAILNTNPRVQIKVRQYISRLQ